MRLDDDTAPSSLTVETMQTKLIHWSTTVSTVMWGTHREPKMKGSTDTNGVIIEAQTEG
jgi:hypothetical protein